MQEVAGTLRVNVGGMVYVDRTPWVARWGLINSVRPAKGIEGAGGVNLGELQGVSRISVVGK